MAHRFEIKYSPHRNQDLVCPQQEISKFLLASHKFRFLLLLLAGKGWIVLETRQTRRNGTCLSQMVPHCLLLVNDV
jgi:hypothetical protein